jgi:hypothetical protein
MPSIMLRARAAVKENLRPIWPPAEPSAARGPGAWRGRRENPAIGMTGTVEVARLGPPAAARRPAPGHRHCAELPLHSQRSVRIVAQANQQRGHLPRHWPVEAPSDPFTGQGGSPSTGPLRAFPGAIADFGPDPEKIRCARPPRRADLDPGRPAGPPPRARKTPARLWRKAGRPQNKCAAV